MLARCHKSRPSLSLPCRRFLSDGPFSGRERRAKKKTPTYFFLLLFVIGGGALKTGFSLQHGLLNATLFHFFFLSFVIGKVDKYFSLSPSLLFFHAFSNSAFLTSPSRDVNIQNEEGGMLASIIENGNWNGYYGCISYIFFRRHRRGGNFLYVLADSKRVFPLFFFLFLRPSSVILESTYEEMYKNWRKLKRKGEKKKR